MIGKALQFTKDVLDQYLKNKYGLHESKVLLNKLIESNGNIPALNQNKVVLSLINIEKETLKRFYQRNQKTDNGKFADINPSERYNLDLLITSNFDDYTETLRYLNSSIEFFQMYPALDAHSFSTIPAGLGKLEFEIEKINYHQMHGLWTSMGAKYQPSVVYKIRLITIQGEATEGYSIAVSAAGSEVGL
jgi:hypothetical protein